MKVTNSIQLIIAAIIDVMSASMPQSWKLSKFDALSQHENSVFFVSRLAPCSVQTSIKLTVVHFSATTDSTRYFVHETHIKSFEKPEPIPATSLSYSLIMIYQPGSSLRVQIKLFNKTYSKRTQVLDTVFSNSGCSRHHMYGRNSWVVKHLLKFKMRSDYANALRKNNEFQVW